jgi:para-nitrobenzyl esterase
MHADGRLAMYPMLWHMLVAAVVACVTALTTSSAQAQPVSAEAAREFAGSWQLVRFESGDGRVPAPADRARYGITLQGDGRLSARIDCNRGRGSWTSLGARQIQFGLLALTRAMCPPGSLHDRIVKDWPAVRSYILKDGHLYLSLMADGGIYEYEPAAEATQR